MGSNDWLILTDVLLAAILFIGYSVLRAILPLAGLLDQISEKLESINDNIRDS